MEKRSNNDQRFDRVRINMEHIVKRHMLPAPENSSYFLSFNVQEIYAIIKKAHSLGELHQKV